MRIGNRRRIRHAAKVSVAIRRPLGMGRRLVVERLEDRALLAVLFEHGPTDAVRVLVPTEEEYSDLGFDWTGVAEPFDDSGWAEVSGQPNGVGFDRGSGAYDSAIGLDVEASMYEQSTTLFARAAFNVPDASAVGALKLRLRYDDAFIAWINGQEVARTNTTGVYPAWDARAESEFEAPLTPVEFDVSDHVSFLHDGTNNVAIRLLNDSLTGDDALLAFTLTGESREGPPLAVDDAVETLEAQAVTIDVLANDREGSDPIDPATVELETPPQHGTAVVNSDGTITYTPNPIYNGPDSFTYVVRDTGAGQSTIETLVASNAPARAFIPTSSLLGTTWRGGDEPFNDAGWQSGTFGVGYDTFPQYLPYIGLNVQAMQNVTTSVYMRSRFTVDSPADVTALELQMRYDDGFVAFINGIQVAADNAPGTLNHTSAALADRPDDHEFRPFDISMFASALHFGDNILAIHGLNSVASSSDLILQPILTATIQSGDHVSNAATVSIDVTGVDYPPIARDDTYSVDEGQTLHATNMSGGGPTTIEVLVSDGSTWLFSDSGQLPAADGQGDTWKDTYYDDTTWSSGPAQLGYGDGDEATIVDCGPSRPICNSGNHITTWFRKHFTIEPGQAGLVESLTLELLRDDGGAVYINGVEVLRQNLPGTAGDNTLMPGTLASIMVGGSDEFALQPPDVIDLASPALGNLLHDGDNVVAVEIHQADATSSDISFDLRLTATFHTSAGVLANDSEPDAQTMTALLETPPVNGALELATDGTFIYMPNTGFVGVDTFTYRASDGTLLSDAATTTITVAHLPPTANADTYATDEDSTMVVPVEAGVLANDVDTQNHPLSAYVVMPPSHGVVVLQPDGSFVYTPVANYHGLDSFIYLATDGQLVSTATDVSITVTSVNDAPAATNDVVAATADEAIIIPWLTERYAAAIASSGPTAYWRLGESSGSTAVDSAGNFDGTYHGSPQHGLGGAIGADTDSAVLFDGVDDYVEHGYSVGLNPTGSFAIEAWARPARLATTYQTLVMSRDVLPGLKLMGYNIYISPSNRWEFWTGSGQRTGQDWDYLNGPTIVPDEWIHLVASFQSLSVGADGVHVGTKQLYVNGHLFVSKSNALYSANTTADFRIGSALAPNRASAPFSGSIDEFALYDHALSAAEVTAHYTTARRGLPALEELIASRASWQYRDNIANGAVYPVDGQGRPWNDRQYNATGWSTGSAILGYGGIDAGPTSTTIGYGGNANDKFRTALFRRTFNVLDREAITGLSLYLLADDGALVYINGREAFRYNMAGIVGDGVVTTSTLAITTGDEATYQSYFVDLASFPNLLVDGQNVIAVEIHQVTASSSDLGFDVALFSVTQPTLYTPGLLDNDVDVEDDALSLEVVSRPQHGMLTVGSGSVTFAPDAGFAGVDVFTYRAFDGQAFSPFAKVTLVVAPPGKAPEDLNADGAVDTGDLAFLLASYGKSAGAKAIEGDLDGNGRIGMRDAIALRNGFTPSPSPAAALVAKASDRAIVQVPKDLDALRVARRERRPSNGVVRATFAATDQALATRTEDVDLLTARRSRMIRRAGR